MNLDAQLQWMKVVMVDPAGPDHGAASAAARQHADSVEEVIEPSRALTAAQRIAIYARMYKHRLIDVVSVDYPAVASLFDEQPWRALLARYVHERPSTDFDLNLYGRDLATFLEVTLHDPVDGLRDDLVASVPRAFVVQMATLEAQLREVLREPVEEPLSLDAKTKPEQLVSQPLRCIAASRLHRFDFPVSTWRDAALRDGASGPPSRQEQWVLVHRQGYRPVHTVWSREAAAVLRVFEDGATLEGGLEAALADPTVSPDALLSGVGAWFSEWQRLGVLRPNEG